MFCLTRLVQGRRSRRLPVPPRAPWGGGRGLDSRGPRPNAPRSPLPPADLHQLGCRRSSAQRLRHPGALDAAEDVALCDMLPTLGLGVMTVHVEPAAVDDGIELSPSGSRAARTKGGGWSSRPPNALRRAGRAVPLDKDVARSQGASVLVPGTGTTFLARAAAVPCRRLPPA